MEENARKRIEKDIEMNIGTNAYIDIINDIMKIRSNDAD